MVTSPAVPPYSSSTTARWVLSRFMSASTSSTSARPRHEQRLADDVLDQARGCRAQRPQHVLGMHHADDLVQRVAVHRVARPSRVRHDVGCLGNANVGLDRDHFGARRHHFFGRLLAELEHPFQQSRITRLQRARFAGLFDQDANLLG